MEEENSRSVHEGNDDLSSEFEGFSIAQTDREIAVPLTPRYSTFKKLEVVTARQINFMARVYNVVSLVALVTSTAVVILARTTFSVFVPGIKGFLPDLTIYEFPPYFTLIDSILSFLVFTYSIGLAALYCVIIFRQEREQILNEQVWVVMLLISTVLYMIPYEPSVRLRRDFQGIEAPNSEAWVSQIFISLKVIAFSVIIVLYLWLGTHSYRFLDRRVSIKNWRFYAPKVIAVLTYDVYKLCVLFIYKITFSEMPFASFVAFLNLYATLGQWPRLGVTTVIILAVMELIILILMARDMFKTFKTLRDAEYTKHRTKILGFRFFLHQQTVFSSIYVITYIVILFGLPSSVQVLQYVVLSTDGNGRGSYFDVQYAPFGLLLCVLAFVTTEAYTNLPANTRIRRILVPCIREPVQQSKPSAEPVVYRNREPPSFSDGQALDIRPNCFIMQTNIDLFNLAWFVYYHGTKKEHSLNLDFDTIGMKIRDYLYHKESDTRVVIAEAHDRVILAFKGTSSTQNLFTDINVVLQPLSNVVEEGTVTSGDNNMRFENLKTTKLYRRSKVHAGFSTAYSTVKARLRELTRSLLDEKDRPIFLTGHSLGGALATLSSFDLSATLNIPGHRVVVTTFGSPRVGNEAFQQIYDSEILANWRVVAGGDIISRIPKLGYRHVGKKVILTATGELFIDPSALEMIFWHSQSASIVHHRKACYLLALRAWCESLGGDYTPDFWPFPVSENDSHKFETTFKKPVSQPLTPRTFRRRQKENRDARLQGFAEAIDALDDKSVSEKVLANWENLVKLTIQDDDPLQIRTLTTLGTGE